MKNIVLTGFMGTGKTAVGKELSRMLDMRVIDIDAEIEKNQKMSINEIFRTHGETYFRDIETQTIKQFAREDRCIIATGGGAVLRDENMDTLREKGTVFCLNAAPETILERTSRSKERPLLNVDDPLSRIREMLAHRRPFYEKAGIMIDTNDKTPLEIAEEIVEILQCRK